MIGDPLQILVREQRARESARRADAVARGVCPRCLGRGVVTTRDRDGYDEIPCPDCMALVESRDGAGI